MAKNRIPADVIVGLDPNKADTELTHKYVLQLKGNESLPEKDKAYVICTYLTVEEMEKMYSELDRERNALGYKKLFQTHVKEIHNLLHPVEDRDITIDELVNAQFNKFIYAVISDVASHLINTGSLNKEEKKT